MNCYNWTDYQRATSICPICNNTRYSGETWVTSKKELVNYNGSNSSGFNAIPFPSIQHNQYDQSNGFGYKPFVDELGSYWSSTPNTSPGTMNSYGYTKAYDFFSLGMAGISDKRIDSFLMVRCLKIR